jgi:hypothetical protein
MAGIKTYVQTDMRVAPTENNHLVRYQDMVNYVNALTTESVRVILLDPFIGTYSNTGLTLTQTTPDELLIDGVVLNLNDRILVASQTDKTQNGIYVVTVLGDSTTAAVLTRAADFDESSKIKNGLIIPVLDGDDQSMTRWKTAVSAVPFVLDGANIEFHKEVTDIIKVLEQTFLIEGDDIEKVYNLSHGWDTMNVTHELYDADGNTVVGEFKRVSSNDVRVIFGVPLGDGNDLTLILRAEVEPV